MSYFQQNIHHFEELFFFRNFNLFENPDILNGCKHVKVLRFTMIRVMDILIDVISSKHANMIYNYNSIFRIAGGHTNAPEQLRILYYLTGTRVFYQSSTH